MRRQRGLLVGCSYPQSSFALDAPGNDIAFFEHLLKQLGFREVRTLSDRKLGLESSHRNNIIRSVQWLVEGAQPGDSLFFAFSGHGLSTAGTLSDRRDDLNRALCASEFEDPFPSNLLFDTELQSIFATLPSGVLLTCVIDAPCGDTVVQVPWFYDAKTSSYGRPPKAHLSSLWAGDRHRRRPNPVLTTGPPAFTVRGAPPCAAKAASTRPFSGSSCELFPGVVVFLLCACRPDQVCLEAPLMGGQSYGLLTCSLAAVLQQTLLDSSDRPCGLNYLQLAQHTNNELQQRLCKVGAQGVEQHLLLGCSQDPESFFFMESIKVTAQIPRSLVTANNLPPRVMANFVAAEAGEPRWPNILVQLCRLKSEAVARINACKKSGDPFSFSRKRLPGQLDVTEYELLSAEVLGEFWLPVLEQLFPGSAALGSIPHRRAFQAKSPRSSSPRKNPLSSHVISCSSKSSGSNCIQEVVCKLRAPAINTEQQCYTWGASVDYQDMFPETSERLPLLTPPASFDPASVASNLPGSIPPTADLSAAAQALRKGPRGTGTMTRPEFEYFAVRYLGLDLELARQVFTQCLESNVETTVQALDAEKLAQVLDKMVDEEHEENQYVLEVRMELSWRSAAGLAPNAGVGEVQILAAEINHRELSDNRLLAHLTKHPDSAMVSQKKTTAPTLPTRHLQSTKKSTFMGQNELSLLRKGIGDLGSALFLRVGLCASRDIYPDCADLTPDGVMVTPRSHMLDASWIVPHIVFASPALLHGVSESGRPYVKMPSPKEFAGGTVPVCTCAKLCETQRLALALPRSFELPGPAKAAEAIPFAGQTVPPLALGPLRPARTNSDSQLRWLPE